jgi:hypothetical protein
VNHLATLERGRQFALARMTETVVAGRFRRRTNASGAAERTLETERYTGVAQVAYPSMVVTGSEAASQEVAAQSLVVKLPVGAALLHEGDEIEVQASTADSALIGRVYRVKGSPQSGQVTSHRYPVEQLS